LITDFEHVILRYETETGVGGLEVVDCLSHISLGCEYECGETFIVAFNLSGISTSTPLQIPSLDTEDQYQQVADRRLEIQDRRSGVEKTYILCSTNLL
jgi:hypothetical protein